MQFIIIISQLLQLYLKTKVLKIAENYDYGLNLKKP